MFQFQPTTCRTQTTEKRGLSNEPFLPAEKARDTYSRPTIFRLPLLSYSTIWCCTPGTSTLITCPVPGNLIDVALELDKAYIPTRYPDAHPSGSPRTRYPRAETTRLIEHAERVTQSRYHMKYCFHIVALCEIMAAHGHKTLLAEAGGSQVAGEVRSLALWSSPSR